MKHLTMFAVLIALAAGPALAQQDMGNTSVSGATYTTGIVESIDGSHLTLIDESGQAMTILIVSGTVGAKNHPVGSRVRVNFHHNEDGQSVADVIQGAPGDVQVAETEVRHEMVVPAPPTPRPATTRVQEPTPTTAVIYDDEPVAETSTFPRNASSTLPRTASSLAAIGLLGLLSLGGALVIRFSR